MLQSATIRVPPSAVESIVVQPRIDTDKPPAIISKEPTGDTDPIASTCALFWEGIRRRKRTERRKHLDQFLAGIRFEKEKRNARLRPEVSRSRLLVEHARREWNQSPRDSCVSIGKRAGAVIEKLLFLGALFEVKVRELQEDKQTERLTFERLRKLQAHAWASIAAFDRACRQKHRIVRLERFERKVLSIAARRAQVFEVAQHDSIHERFREFYKLRGIHARPGTLQETLISIGQLAASQQLPEGWEKLIANLRRFFYEADPHFSTRDAVKSKGRIKNFAGRRGLRTELDVFNLTSFLRLVLGWTADDANALTGSIAFPAAHASDTGNASDTVKKYRQRFKRRFSRPPESTAFLPLRINLLKHCNLRPGLVTVLP